jgi:hypothetical protein
MAPTKAPTREATTGLVVRLPDGTELPLVVSPAQVKEVTGDRRSDHAIRDDCARGVIPTLPRGGGSGAHHRIATAPYLDRLGVPYTIVRAGST